jgi:hypothetical protein
MIMKTEPFISVGRLEAILRHSSLVMLGTVIVLAALVLLPVPALFLAVLVGAIGLGAGTAELRRRARLDLPGLPMTHSD